MPASINISVIFAATIEDVSAGLRMVQFPVTKVATVMPVAIAKGKFQGAITTAIPFP